MAPDDDLFKDYAYHPKKGVDPVSRSRCAYCGAMFLDSENRIEKKIYGRVWAFCSDNCVEDFMDASNFKDEDYDMIIEEGDSGFEINLFLSGPEIDDDYLGGGE